MSYLRKSKKSAFWSLRYRDLDTGRWREETTRFRHDDPAQSRAAQKLCHTACKEEAQVAALPDGEFSDWVPTYITRHYKRAPSLKRYEAAWLRLSQWLRKHRLRHPRQIRYDHVEEYMTWRNEQGVSQNTSRLEMKFFSFLMREAMRRDFCEKNPIALANIPRKPSPEKPDLQDDSLLAARAAFTKRPAWMRTVFEICSHIGCRFAESSLPMSRVDFDKKLIWIEDSKRDEGDPRKIYAVPMPDSLINYLLTLKGQERTTQVLTREMNRTFNIVLKASTGATSHSLRVSFISRCHRAGLSEAQAMRLVNHSTRMVHRIYSRLSVDDARAAMAQVAPPPLSPGIS